MGVAFSFDQRANGFVPGEAVGVLMLKRLADAERDQDRILAVVEGWGVNQDGKTNGITAPNEESQTRLLQSVYRKFDIDPAGIQLIEAHGTGTKLGDPIEVAGLKAAFKPFTDKAGYCALGSVKSNIGHCLTAAGAAGFIKLILALKHRALPPTINYAQGNEHIHLGSSPFYVNDKLKPWHIAQGETRRAAISSFGFSGTNAHLVIAEHTPGAQARRDVSMLTQDGRVMVPLSAKTEAQLRRKVEDLLQFIRHNPSLDLQHLAYTLQVGRDAMGERLGFMVASTEMLADMLETWLAGKPDGIHQGQVKRNREELKLIAQDDEMRATIVGKWLGERKLSKLMGLWVKGLDLDWTLLYGEARPQRIELPNYPFARERFWLTEDASVHAVRGFNASANASAAGVLHPLLQRNVSVLSQQRYSSHFSGDEFFCDQEIDGVRVLSPSSLLEMARAAMEFATDAGGLSAPVELGEISWDAPLPVSSPGGIDVVNLSANEDESASFEILAADVTHVRGVVRFVERASLESLNIASSSQMPEGFDASAFYAGLEQAGIGYGPALQVLKDVRCSEEGIVAHLVLPAPIGDHSKDYVLHPALLEGAMQACMVLIGDEASARAALPVSMETLTILSACENEMFAWIRRVDGDGALHTFDIVMLDAQGNCRIAIRGLALEMLVSAASAAFVPAITMTTPQWVTVRPVASTPASVGQVLVIGANSQQQETLSRHMRVVAFIVIRDEDSVSEIAAKLEGLSFDRLLWIASAHDTETLTEESILADQQRGIMQVLRLARALTQLGYENRVLDWDLVTLNSLPVRKSDSTNPTHAGLQGFAGSMAEVYPRWAIRMLDLPEVTEAALAGMRTLPNANKACYALRGREWFSQKLVPVQTLASGQSPYRAQGVYVVIGGSGGIGEIWTRHLIRHHDAYVIWIGRRPLDEQIQQKLDALSALGRAPEYIQADASKREELEAAYARIKDRHPVIHGVVHSAVGAFDQSLKTVSEADFRRILSVKIDLSVRIAQVFGREALDFLLFFSSNASFVRGAGMSGYSAGCTFKDAFARQLDKQWACKVKVVNWGYWSVGAGEAMTDAMKAYFHEVGYRPLDADEGMQALDQFLVSGFGQMSIGKSVGPTAEHLEIDDESIAVYDDHADSASLGQTLAAVRDLNFASRFAGVTHEVGEEMEALLARLLRGILDAAPNVLPLYERWLLESRKISATCGGDEESLEQIWREWEAAMQRWLQIDGKRGLCVLIDKCMRALPAILTGRQKATDVIFPNSSLALAENFYKTDTVSMAYNECLGDTLLAAVRARLQHDPHARISLLEIGAGTGATTVGIIDKLESCKDRIAEYCYTDLSKAFLFHAEKVYAPRAPYLRTRLFDAAQPIAAQGIAAGQYDVVIAANVLHATRNIRTTLRNAKAVLRKGGILLLNEISDKSVCAHLTFGLLNGWWLNEDDEIRIPGSPGLYVEGWRSVLEEEGFHSVQFACEGVRIPGQQHQIILAFSDGIVRQKKLPATKPRAANVKSVETRPVIAPVRRLSETVSAVTVPSSAQRDSCEIETLLKEKTVQFCRQLIGKALKIDSQQIDAAEPLESYGIDSIIVGLVNQQLQKHFGEISATLLYEFQTVNALSSHLLETHRETLERLFELDGSANVPATVVAPRVDAPAAEARHAASANTDDALRDRTVQFCKQLIGTALKIGSDQIDAAEPLERYGIDSIIVGLVNQQLQKHFGEISATVLYEFQTVDALSGHLVDAHRDTLVRLFRLDRPAAGPIPAVAAMKRPQIARRSSAPARATLPARAELVQHGASTRDAIAIIGISGRYPLASSLEEFWENLKSGRNCITEIPDNRWSLKGFYEPDEHKAVEQGKSYCKWGGFLDQFAEFDTLFFGIPPREALNMDPQERLFMQAAWGAMENAGYTRSMFKRKFKGSVGVFAGITRAGYNLYRDTARNEDKFWPRTSFSSVANRLSYFLDINGPSLPVDTMCSSSLTAIHEACEHIHNGDCALAFAGGVNLYLHPTSYVNMSSQHMLSKDGSCRSFGEGANGFVPGEGVGVVLLKSLDRAVQDEDVIHGVILSTHVNHGGKTNGFTVPNPVAQAELIRTALDKAGISARDVSYIEAHGTGTELGDPIEIAGLQQAFARDTQDKGYCRIGSAKSNIGHLEAAAGIAALTKVLLQLKHQQIVPTLHAASVNPHIRFEKTPFQVNQSLSPWERPDIDGRSRPRIAGISSFGAGGANAHVIVQEYQPVFADVTATHTTDNPVVIPLSAKSREQLQQKASDLLDFLGMANGSADLAAIAYTLQIGREAMEMRLGFVVHSVEQLTRNLSAYVYGEEGIAEAYSGQVQRKSDAAGMSLGALVQDEDMSEAIDKWIARRKYSKILELWVKGWDFDWARLYDGSTPRRIQLPTYPFAKDEYWLDSVTANARVDDDAEHRHMPATAGDLQVIEDLIRQIDEASIAPDDGARLLRKLV